ncbi:MAG TPA: hypothetical protein VMF30_10335 [Pirellulales bacterium]|nr:hypothetical protein [Pirellulales bacterium]
MLRPAIVCTVLCVLCCPWCRIALAGGVKRPTKSPLEKRGLAQFDRNGDGKLDADERAAALANRRDGSPAPSTTIVEKRMPEAKPADDSHTDSTAKPAGWTAQQYPNPTVGYPYSVTTPYQHYPHSALRTHHVSGWAYGFAAASGWGDVSSASGWESSFSNSYDFSYRARPSNFDAVPAWLRGRRAPGWSVIAASPAEQ